MSNETGQVMRRNTPYVMMDVTSLRDNRLSWKAKGLMTYFLDKPENWKFMMKAIYNASTDGETSVRAGLKELQEYGYLVRVAFRKNNKLSHYEFLIYEEPVTFPSQKAIHVDHTKWKSHLDDGGTIDITLFVENLNSGKQQTGNLNSGFGDTLLSINNTKDLKEPITKQQQQQTKNDCEEKQIAVVATIENLFDKKITANQAHDLLNLSDQQGVNVMDKIQNTHDYHTQAEKRNNVIGAIKHAITHGDWEITNSTPERKSKLTKAVAGTWEEPEYDKHEMELRMSRIAEKLAELRMSQKEFQERKNKVGTHQ